MKQVLITRLLRGLEKLGTPHFVSKDNRVFISAEHENSYKFCDYYGEYRGGYPWIDDKLTKLVESHGCYFEWQNPGCIGIYER